MSGKTFCGFSPVADNILDRIVYNTDSGIYWVYKQAQDGRYTIRERRATIPEIEQVKEREEDFFRRYRESKNN